jgi:hypothetical protein
MYCCFQCKIGYTGTGRYCGLDSDLDGHPDKTLPCTVWKINGIFVIFQLYNLKNGIIYMMSSKMILGILAYDYCIKKLTR